MFDLLQCPIGIENLFSILIFHAKNYQNPILIFNFFWRTFIKLTENKNTLIVIYYLARIKIDQKLLVSKSKKRNAFNRKYLKNLI